MLKYSTNEFKNKYPRQFNYLIKYYGGRSNIFDVRAAIELYLRNEPPPVCELCNQPLSINKKFRKAGQEARCRKHSNTKIIISVETIYQKETDNYKIAKLPDKLLTNSDVIEINCIKHGHYKVGVGNFIKGMSCQKCYLESLSGVKRQPHSAQRKQNISASKIGKSVNLSDESKAIKSAKQKAAWENRKKNKDVYDQYLLNLSTRRKMYIAEQGFQFPKKEKTSLEIKFANFLKCNNVEYVTSYVLGGKKFDFFLPQMQLLVEVDGEYWHRLPPSIKNDVQKHRICKEHQIMLVRISSDDYDPNIIFEDQETQEQHNSLILIKRGINEF